MLFTLLTATIVAQNKRSVKVPLFKATLKVINILLLDPNIFLHLPKSNKEFGLNFKVINSFSASLKNFSYTPFTNGNIYSPLKVISATGITVYSNVITLINTGNVVKVFNVSTSIYNDISENASANFQYILNDINGKIIAKGNGGERLQQNKYEWSVVCYTTDQQQRKTSKKNYKRIIVSRTYENVYGLAPLIN